jgi:hypothetical protein
MLKTTKLRTNRIGRLLHNGPDSNLPKLSIQITAPQMRTAKFEIVGTAPLVIHRFSAKAKAEMIAKMEAGSQAAKGKKRKPANLQEMYNEARYISPAGWDGFNVASIRNGLIRACSIPAVNFKMTLAKMSVFVIADDYDKIEPWYGLIRIYGKPERTEMAARTSTGECYICVRPMYRDWSANLNIRFDSDTFSLHDISNLLSRMGEQVGIGEGRPASKDSAGMGWGTFKIGGK